MHSLFDYLDTIGTHFQRFGAVFENELLPPHAWDRAQFETELAVSLPQELVDLWNRYADMFLCVNEQRDFGLHIFSPGYFSPRYLIDLNRTEIPMRSQDFVAGDLIIGEFLEGVESVVLRCDPDAPDYGCVLIAREIMPREDWPVVAPSLNIFIRNAWRGCRCTGTGNRSSAGRVTRLPHASQQA